MIAQLTARWRHIEDGCVVLDVGGGFAVHIPLTLALRVSDMVTLYTHLQVRENELTYTALLARGRQLFDCCWGVSGVGPKAALSVMNPLSPDTLRLQS